MTSADLKLSRDFLLRALARFPRGMSEESLSVVCNGAGMEFEAKGPDSMEAALIYLADKGFIARVQAAHTPSHSHWRITGAGDDYLRTARLA